MNTTLVNAIPFTVTYGFGPKKGQLEEICYKEHDLEEIYVWAELTRDKRTPKLIAYNLGKDLAWVKTLSFQSAAQLARKIFDLNFPNAITLLEDPVMASLLRQMLMEAAEMIKTLTPEQLQQIEAAGRPGSGSSATPPPSASPAATGSESSSTLPVGSTSSSPSASA